MEEKKNKKIPADDMDAAIKTAQFRFPLIAPVIQGLVPDESDTAYLYHEKNGRCALPLMSASTSPRQF